MDPSGIVSGLLAGLIGTGLGSVIYGGPMMGDETAAMVGCACRVGLVILLAPVLLQRARFGERAFRIQLLASLLVFCVLFNHQAESPSYSIAMIGAAVWYASSAGAVWRTWLVVACLAIVNLGSTDLLPRALYRAYYVPYLLKTVPLVDGERVRQEALKQRHGGSAPAAAE